ncbi:MAG: hypothetical protein ACTSU2_09500 [Promethearchaeota archaeon]
MIELEAKIPDTPGALIKLIKPISENAGNIYGILHKHKEKSAEGLIPVFVTFELITEDKKASLQKIKEKLLEYNFRIMKITDIPAAHQITVILSGHIFRQNFEDTIMRISKVGARVHNMEAKFNKPEEISNVIFSVEIPDTIEDQKIIDELERICSDKNLKMILEEKI